MRYSYLVFAIATLTTSCSTLNDSLQLGASLGAGAGALATYVGHSTGGESPSFGTVALGAGVGSAIGMLTAYLTHKQLEEQRHSDQADSIDMHFGDLPPSPFIVPKTKPKKAVRR